MPATTEKTKADAPSRTELRSRRILPQDQPRRGRPSRRLTLDGRRLDMQVGPRLLDVLLERTIDGPSTLTIDLWNGDNRLFTVGILGAKALATADRDRDEQQRGDIEPLPPELERDLRVERDGLAYIGTGLHKTGATTSLTFEPEPVTIAKRHGRGKPLRIPRSEKARAGVCADMLRDAGVPVLVLDEHVVQEIAGGRAKLRDKLEKARRDAASGSSSTSAAPAGRAAVRGVTGAGLTIKGAAPTAEQRRNIATCLRVARELDAPKKAVVAMLVGGIGETGFKAIPNSAGSGYHGVFQGSPDYFGIGDTEEMCRSFFLGGKGFHGGGAIRMANENPNLSPGAIATEVERSGQPPWFYQQHWREALAWLRAAGDDFGDLGDGTGGTARLKPVIFDRRRNESTWQACWRLLEAVRWRLFDREGVIVIAHEEALARAEASVVFHQGDDVDLDLEWLRGLRVREASGSIYAGAYAIDPGEVATVEGLPPAARDWLIASTSVSLLKPDPLVAFTVRKPIPPKPEPANEIETIDGSTSTRGATGAASGLYEACQKIHDQRLPYVWGGGHARAGTPDRGDGSDPGTGYDCSGSVGAALAMVGWGYRLGQSVPASGSMTGWGAPGRGKTHTLWANATHVFLELNFPGQPAKAFDTRRTGANYESGPRLRTILGPTAGFVPRHWPGH